MATAEEVFQRWFTEVGRTDPQYLYSGENLLVVKEDLRNPPAGLGETHTSMLLYRTMRNRRDFSEAPVRYNPPSIRMGLFVGERFAARDSFCLINGDGFVDRNATMWQARIRELATNMFTQERAVTIPYAALTSAAVILPSIQTIEVSPDRNDTVQQQLPALDQLYPMTGGSNNSNDNPLTRMANDGSIDSAIDRLRANGWIRNDAQLTDSRNLHIEGTYEGHRLQLHFYRSGNTASYPWGLRDARVWAQPEFGIPAWQQLRYNEALDAVTNRYVYRWHWVERVHRLGATLFSGISSNDNRRHRFLSAFDMQEQGGLYFLAMLPDGPADSLKTYDDAIGLLAPPMVHQAREAGLRVPRQGDVFAVPTEWTDEDIFGERGQEAHGGVSTRVRRNIVLQRQAQSPPDTLEQGRRMIQALIPPAEGEVRERGTCLCCHERTYVGNGPLAQQALSIHGTGHTADEVVVMRNGVTFIRGTMYHDPQIEDVTRTNPDHQPRALGDFIAGDISEPRPWHIAIRNTVPQLRPARRRTNAVSVGIAAPIAEPLAAAPLR